MIRYQTVLVNTALWVISSAYGRINVTMTKHTRKNVQDLGFELWSLAFEAAVSPGDRDSATVVVYLCCSLVVDG